MGIPQFFMPYFGEIWIFSSPASRLFGLQKVSLHYDLPVSTQLIMGISSEDLRVKSASASENHVLKRQTALMWLTFEGVWKNKTNISQHVMDNHSSRHGQTAWWSVRNQIPSNTNSPGCNRLVRTPIFDGHIIVWWTTQILVSVPIFGNKSTSLLVKPLFSFPTCWFFAPNNSDTVKS